MERIYPHMMEVDHDYQIIEPVYNEHDTLQFFTDIVKVTEKFDDYVRLKHERGNYYDRTFKELLHCEIYKL